MTLVNDLAHLISEPPIYDQLIKENRKASPQLQDWLLHIQGAINLFMAGFKRGSYTTVAGSATQTITAPNVKAGDLVFAVVATTGATPRTILSQAAANGQIIVTMSGDPSTDHVLNWLAISS